MTDYDFLIHSDWSASSSRFDRNEICLVRSCKSRSVFNCMVSGLTTVSKDEIRDSSRKYFSRIKSSVTLPSLLEACGLTRKN